ncbi:hypothetical protein Tco_0816139 [Tanacetum coccineum]
MDEPLGLGCRAARRRALELTELGAYVEFQGWLIYDHAQRLDALPPTLFRGYDRDLRELYTRALWRLVLALEAWAGHVDTRMADMSRVGYDNHRLIHDMLVKQAALQCEL